MDVLGHEDVGGNAETLLFAGLFEDLLEGVFCFFGVEEGLALYSPRFVKGGRRGGAVFCGVVRVKRRGLGGAGGLHPTLRRSAKDGAPGVFGLVRVERRFLSWWRVEKAGNWWCWRFASHPS